MGPCRKWIGWIGPCHFVTLALGFDAVLPIPFLCRLLHRLWARYATPSVVVSRLLAWCRYLLAVCGGTTTDVEAAALARLQASVLALCLHVCPIRGVDSESSCAPDLAVELVLARSGAVDIVVTACSDALRVLRCSRPAATSHLDRLDEAVRLAVVVLVGPAFMACADGLQRAVRALPRLEVAARAALLSPEGTLEFDRLPLQEMMDLRDFMAVLAGAV
jgi:hypothetical protein